MRILAIETSCDETSIAIMEFNPSGNFKILSNIVSSQVKVHAPFGGVVPMLAKREHQKNLVPILKRGLKEAGINISTSQVITTCDVVKLNHILSRESELLKKLLPFIKKFAKPNIDLIAVTNGPGLEPALWVGVNFAKALAYFWDLPVIPINHVEAHIIANWLENSITQSLSHSVTEKIFPAVSIVVSGGHTQLILMRDFGQYKILGETRDDAAGEAFDKLAKMLNLGYPGGPVISQIAAKFNSEFRNSNFEIDSKFKNPRKGQWPSGLYWQNSKITLPRPMINSKDYDFSFSGLKTAALYFVKTLDKKTLKKLTPAICAEFQQAVIDVLVAKTIRAAKEFGAKTVLLSGGVASNDLLRETLKQETEKLKLKTNKLKTNFLVPPKNFCTDNAAMIALTAAKKTTRYNWQDITTDSNLRLA